MSPQAVAQFLAQTAILRGVPADVLAKLAPHVEQATVPAGRALVAPGTIVATLGFLASGKASVQILDAMGGARTTLEEVHPGDVFGEIGMTLGTASPIIVVADEECDVLLVHKAHLDKIAGVVPDVHASIAKRISARFVKVSVLGGKRASGPPPAPLAVMDTVPGAPPGINLGSLIPKGVIPFVEVAAYPHNPKALELLPTRIILEHRLLPLDLRGRSLIVGMVSPHSIQAKEDMRRALHTVDPEIVAISADDFAQAIVRLKIDVRDQRSVQAGQAVSRALRPQYQAEIKKEADKQLHVLGDEVVQLLDRILSEALDRGVSDVHIEPEATFVRVRFRVQGMLSERKEMIPTSYGSSLVARVKVLAELDITERRLPQDGRIVAQFGPREVNFRVSTMPAARGEKVVIRVLDPSDVVRPLEQIFADPRTLEIVARANAATNGAILVGGATGCGKSSTVYSLLNARKAARPDNNIATIEDPVEFLVAGFSQSPVNVRAGLEYSYALRSILRQDPDVIMVGELRDAPTAQTVLEASLSGRLILTTLHASGVTSVVQRLEHFGCTGMRVAQSVNAIIVQRLSRRLCNHCTREEEVAPQLVEALIGRRLLMKGASPKLPRAIGCEACLMSGYRGRVSAHEVLLFDDDVRAMIGSAAPLPDVLAQAGRTGTFLPFSHCARLLMAKRAITPADALAITD